MFYRDFTEEQMSPIISYIIGGEKFRAISAYRDLDRKSSSEEVIMRVIEVANKISEWLKNKDFALKHVPSVCCVNCIGICSEWKAKMKDGGFNTKQGKFEGSGCQRFVSVNDFIKDHKDCQISFIKADRPDDTRDVVKIKVEKNISSIAHEVFNRRQKRVVKVKKRILLVNEDNVLKHVVTMTRRGYRINSTENVPNTLTVNGKKPLKGDKNYREYFNRCQKEIRENNKKVEEQVYKMSYEDACSEFLKTTSPSEKSIIASLGGDVKSYLRDFYNGQSVWQVLEQLKKS